MAYLMAVIAIISVSYGAWIYSHPYGYAVGGFLLLCLSGTVFFNGGTRKACLSKIYLTILSFMAEASIFCSVGLIAYGAWMHYPPLGYVVGGFISLCILLLASLAKDKD